MPDHWHDRMATILDNPEVNDASARGRINAWKFAYLVAQKEPFGAGFDAFTLANVYARKSRLKSRIKSAKIVNKELFLNLLG
jgi:O-antigen ligase